MEFVFSTFRHELAKRKTKETSDMPATRTRTSDGGRIGSALVITLISVVLISALALTLFLVAKSERLSSSLALGKVQSDVLANVAMDLALTKMKEATEAGMQNGKMWVSEPGRIRVLDVANLSVYTDYNLFSGFPGADSTIRDENNVDLNRPGSKGDYPIAAPAYGKTAANMKVGWINLLANPAAAASSTNRIIGRVAYWVDDESCKVNINTADGSKKEDLYRILPPNETSQSFGFGTPSEISLEALKDSDGTPMARAVAAEVSKHAWEKGFNTSAELSQIAGIPAGFYEDNKFNLTQLSKTPELTFFGEPRINLMPAVLLSTGAQYSLNLGGYAPTNGGYGLSGNLAANNAQKQSVAGIIDFIYPTSSQLPTMLVGDMNGSGSQTPTDALKLTQYVRTFSSGRITRPTSVAAAGTANYPFYARIARAIKGFKSDGTAFTWPQFSATAQPDGFAKKYSDRQIDTITFNLADMSTQSINANQWRGYNYPTFTVDGMLSGKSAIGLGRSPILTEMLFSIDAFRSSASFDDPSIADNPANPTADDLITPNVPTMQILMELEHFMPPYFSGSPMDAGDHQIGSEGSHNHKSVNDLDHNGEYISNKPGEMGHPESGPNTPIVLSHWNDVLLRIVDAGDSNEPLAGIDLRGHRKNSPDLDPRASTYHPYAFGQGGTNWFNAGTTFWTQLRAYTIGSNAWVPGDYHGNKSVSSGGTDLYGKPGVTKFGIRGGVSAFGRDASGGISWQIVPLDSARTTKFGITGELATDPTVAAEMKQAVIPMPDGFDVDIPSFDNLVNMRVADPLVNKFPGDWIVKSDPPASEMTITSVAAPAKVYTTTGHNPEYLPANGGDPLSVWLPRQDIRYPKQSRFPSVGALNYVRTGVIPDDLLVGLPVQKGTPWRSVNFSASDATSQSLSYRATGASGVSSYPDWAMLDLFAVPFTPQLPYDAGTTATPIRKLTYGGATEGKLSINNPKVPFPFSQVVSGVTSVPPERTSPLEALFLNVRTSTSYNIASPSNPADPLYVSLNANGAATLREAVQDYLEEHGPFVLTGQLADVPEVAGYVYSGVKSEARSRNDLMREVVGATSVQSNVYSIWIVAQSVRKNPRGSDPGVYQSGDAIVGETRRRLLVERFIDYGIDGVPGNAANPGADGVVGTEDDVIDANYHKALTYPLPYKWKVVGSEAY